MVFAVCRVSFLRSAELSRDFLQVLHRGSAPIGEVIVGNILSASYKRIAGMVTEGFGSESRKVKEVGRC